MSGYSDDVTAIKVKLKDIPLRWEGKACVLEMKTEQYHWRQTEWWAFYFELLCKRHLSPPFTMPGDRCGTVLWDAKRSINWDLKAKAIKTDSTSFILNDVSAMDASVKAHGEHGVLIALCDVEYNDANRTFQNWRTELQGGKSKYTLARELRTSASRYRKTLAVLVEVLFVRIDGKALTRMAYMAQGRNSNGKARPRKYMFDLESCADLVTNRVVVGKPLA